MTIHQLDPAVLGFQPCLPDGKIREKFVAVGDIIGIGHFRNHPDLIRAMLRGPLANFPQDFTGALRHVLERRIPVAFGNILTDHTIELLPDADHDINNCKLHHESIMAALTPIPNRD